MSCNGEGLKRSQALTPTPPLPALAAPTHITPQGRPIGQPHRPVRHGALAWASTALPALTGAHKYTSPHMTAP